MRFTRWLPLLSLSACAPAPPARIAPGPPPEPPVRSAQMVNATILANGCEELGKASARLAERVMYELVEGCTSVPGGSARFAATLLPGGQIKIAAVTGQLDVVPICILKHPLVHKVPLERPCRLDVNIAQTSVPVSSEAGR